MHHFGPARRVVAIVATTSFLTAGLVVTSAMPAAAACGQDGTWIGTWAGGNGVQSLNGVLEIDNVTFSTTAMTGTVSFVTGTTIVLNNQAVHARVGSDCHDLTSGTVGSPTKPFLTFSGSLEPDGAGMTGLFTQTGTTFRGNFESGRVTNSASNPQTTNLTFPTGETGATPANPVWVNVLSPTSGHVAIGVAQVPAGSINGWALLGPSATGLATKIVAPGAQAGDPLVLTFEFDKSLFPDPQHPDASIIQGFRNGDSVTACSSPNGTPFANPDPCIPNPTGRPLANGNPRFVVYSSGASVWAFGRATRPSAPRFPIAVPGNGSATVSWTKPTRSGGPAITRYTVTPYLGQVALTPRHVAASAKKAVITGLANGKAYTFTVAANNVVGAGPPATTSKAIVVGAPTAPKSQSATAGAESATVKWLVPASDNGAPITGYVVSVIEDDVFQTAVPFNSPATAQTITGLAPGGKYTFHIAAKNARGVGPRSGATKPVTPT